MRLRFLSLLPAIALVFAAPGCGTRGGEPDGGEVADGGDGGDLDGGDGGEEIDPCLPRFQYGLGFPCNFDGDCGNGRCVSDGYRTFCSGSCVDLDCPAGYTCQQASRPDGRFCFPDLGTPLPYADESLGAGSPCFGSEDCADDATCTSVGPVWLCAKGCEEDVDCGECGQCRREYDRTEGICTPRGAKPIGKKCRSPYECGSFECHGFCTQQCTFADCPEGSECEYLGDRFSLCIDPAQRKATPAGEACTYDFECVQGSVCQPAENGSGRVCGEPRGEGAPCTESGQCREGLRCVPNVLRTENTCQPPGKPGAGCYGDEDCVSPLTCQDFALDHGVCTVPCTEATAAADCGSGNLCVSADVDTALELYGPDEAADPLLENDDHDFSRGLNWSRIDFEPMASGRYWLKVRTPGRSGGPYTLTVLRFFEEPAEVDEAETDEARNDDLSDAQELDALPVIVNGRLDSANDVDFYTFVVTELGRIHFRTSRGPPSVCLAESVYASAPIGEPCVFHLQCATDFCDDALGACIDDCSSDMTLCKERYGLEEGSSLARFACVDLETSMGCVRRTHLYTIPQGDPCRFSFECAPGPSNEKGICAKTFQRDPFCTIPCQLECAGGAVCEEIFVRERDQLRSAKACIPQ